MTRLVLLTALALPAAAPASPAGDALRELARDTWVQRSLSLEDLGLNDPAVLRMSENQQDYYLPVPKGLRLADATLTVDGRYIRGEESPPTLGLSIDGRPVMAQRMQEREGSITRPYALDAHARDSGFVHLRVDWGSPIGRRICDPDRPTANVLTLAPTTRLAYRFASSDLTTLDDAWSTLPGKPVLLIASGKLEQTSYDAAWRAGVALGRAGKRARVSSLPAVGDTVALDGLAIPAGLADVKGFAALRGKDEHRLADAAELGAWIVAGGVQADLVIADAAFSAQLKAALDALQAQLQNDSDAVAGLKAWRDQHAGLADAPPASQQVKLGLLGKQTVIAIAPDAGAQAAGLFDSQWRRVLAGPQASLHSAGQNPMSGAVRLSDLGGSTQAFDVITRGDWTINFPLSSVSADGRIPGELVLDVAAAPGAAASPPVVSVLWNGVLLDARRLTDAGQPARLTSRVPGYALGVNNVLRVSFQRQSASPDCAETPQAYPVNVLASSHLRPTPAEPDGTFVGLLPLLAGSPQLILPPAWLDKPAESLPHVIPMATASALSPARAELVLADKEAQPTKPFLAMGVTVAGAAPLIEVVEGKRLRVGGRERPWLDLEGPEPLSAASVVKAGKQSGIAWYALGKTPVTPSAAFVLSRGDGVVLGAKGPLAWVDTTDPGLSRPPGAAGGTFYEWRNYLSWGLPALGIVLVLGLLLALAVRRARKRRENSH
ncbi:hypothetical protein AW878_01650 [Bordetella pseudohinzii]|nr:hypothetical protein AW877_02525 [Bordetella pseudohinzii]KXA82769.1 hypothetical protein AW878_01650 [Bordetella pseudohinzii]